MACELIEGTLRPAKANEKRTGSYLLRALAIYENPEQFSLVGFDGSGNAVEASFDYFASPDEREYYTMPVVVDDGQSVLVETFVDLTTGEAFAVMDDVVA